MRRKLKEVYDHGLPFTECLAKEIIEPCVKDLKRHPKILIIDGAPGTGKTTLAVHIADYVNGNEVNLEHTQQLAMGGADLMQKSEECSKAGYKVIIYDEADIDKRGALTRFNNNIFGFFREYRSLGILIIIIIQNVEWLDNRIWSLGVVQGLIHLKNPQKDYTEFEVYDLENISWLLSKMDKLGKFQSIKAYNMCRGYMRGCFLNLNESRSRQLAKLSDSQKKTSRKKRIKRVEKPKKG